MIHPKDVAFVNNIAGAAVGAITGGVVGGALSVAQGGTFSDGFASGVMTGMISGAIAGGLAGYGNIANGNSCASSNSFAFNPINFLTPKGPLYYPINKSLFSGADKPSFLEPYINNLKKEYPDTDEGIRQFQEDVEFEKAYNEGKAC